MNDSDSPRLGGDTPTASKLVEGQVSPLPPPPVPGFVFMKLNHFNFQVKS